MLRLEGVTKTYRVGAFGTATLTAVDDVSLDLAPGEVVSLIGESGSGKTTLGKTVLGLIRPTKGTITLDGRTYELAANNGPNTQLGTPARCMTTRSNRK